MLVFVLVVVSDNESLCFEKIDSICLSVMKSLCIIVLREVIRRLPVVVRDMLLPFMI